MPNFTDITGLGGVASMLAASMLLLPQVKRLASRQRALATGTVFVAALIPLGGMPIAAYVRGATGDLSVTTLVLLWCALLRPLGKTFPGCEAHDSNNRLALLALIALASLALYPMTLGLGPFDPYRLGYGSGWFAGALCLLALGGWLAKYHLVALSLSLSVLAWSIGWYESSNLWDYPLDPFVSIYALGVLLGRAATWKSLRLRGWRKRSAPD